MRVNRKRLSAATVIAAALLLMMAVVGFSQGPPEGRRGGPDRGFHGGPGGGPPRDGLGPLARDLNLTDEQKAQIKKINDSFADSTKTLREQMRTLHENGVDPLSGAAFDEAAVRAAAQARANVQIELEVAHARMMSQIFAVLTPEQKTQLAAKRQEFEQRHRERDAQHQDGGDERP
jgi:Spy/CpxP family protein refolding chaperone